MRRAIYPGSFDPVTNGHLDVIGRASRLFDEVIVAVAYNDAKVPLFTMEERVEQLEKVLAPIDNVRVECFHGLLIEYARRPAAVAINGGLRAAMPRPQKHRR